MIVTMHSPGRGVGSDANAKDNELCRFNLDGGRQIQRCLDIFVDDAGNLTSAGNITTTGVMYTPTFDTNVAAAGVTLSGTTLAADGTDANIDINLTPKGTGSLVLSTTLGVGVSDPCSLVEIRDDDAHPILSITAAHNTDYDPQIQFRTDATDTVKCSLGVDSGDSDKFKIYMGEGIGDTSQFVLTNTGLGIGESLPETLLEITGTAPYIQTHNSTEEDADEGRESFWIAKGEQSGGEETTLGYMKFAHYGSSDDEKGYIEWATNDGSDGDSPTAQMRLLSNGSLGIGTLNPAAKLDVNGTINTGTGLVQALGHTLFYWAAADTALLIGSADAVTYNNSIQFRINGATNTYLTSNGLGISTNPTAKGLEINKDIGAPSDLGNWEDYQIVIRGGSDTGDSAGMLFSTTADQYGGSAIVHYDTGGGGQGDLVFYTKQSTAAVPPVEAMRLGDDGLVDVTGNFTAGTIQADNGFTGSFTNGDGDTVTVVGGIITDVS